MRGRGAGRRSWFCFLYNKDFERPRNKTSMPYSAKVHFLIFLRNMYANQKICKCTQSPLVEVYLKTILRTWVLGKNDSMWDILGSLWASHHEKNIHRYLFDFDNRDQPDRLLDYLCVTTEVFFSSLRSHQKESPNINLSRFLLILIKYCFYLSFTKEKKSSSIAWFTFFSFSFFFFLNFWKKILLHLPRQQNLLN